MLLVIDVGNTNIALGVYKDAELVADWRIRTELGREVRRAFVADEGPAPGATDDLKLPGSDEAAHIAAEMAALEAGAEAEAP